jgi:ketosteroid isomerase-like protein
MNPKTRLQENLEKGVQFASLATVIFLLLVSLAWAGGDFWKTKPYTQWTQDDIRQIMYDSPWARLERVPMEWLDNQRQGRGANPMERAPGSAGMAQTLPQGPGSAGAQAAGGGPGANYPNGGLGGGATPDYGAPSMLGTPEGQTVFVVRWNSSQTLREAIIRSHILSGDMKEADAAHYLGQPVTDYEITVIGQDMTPFGMMNPDDLKTKTYLQVKPSKLKVSPTSMQVQHAADGKTVLAVMFSFPRKTQDGKDLITPNDKAIQFVVKTKELDLNAGFDLRKMVNAKGLDL